MGSENEQDECCEQRLQTAQGGVLTARRRVPGPADAGRPRRDLRQDLRREADSDCDEACRLAPSPTPGLCWRAGRKG